MLVHLLNKAQLPYMSKGISTDKGNMGNRLLHLAFFASAGVVGGGAALHPHLQPCSPAALQPCRGSALKCCLHRPRAACPAACKLTSVAGSMPGQQRGGSPLPRPATHPSAAPAAPAAARRWT
jgi:hypothetical protein